MLVCGAQVSASRTPSFVPDLVRGDKVTADGVQSWRTAPDGYRYSWLSLLPRTTTRFGRGKIVLCCIRQGHMPDARDASDLHPVGMFHL